MAGDRRFPGDIFGGAPLDRQLLAGVVPLPGGTAKFGPVFGTRGQDRDQQEASNEQKQAAHGGISQKGGWREKARLSYGADSYRKDDKVTG